MFRFLVKRLFGSVAVLLATSLLAYLLIYLAPGDPATVILARTIGRFPTKEQVAQFRVEYGLDQPPIIQYVTWASQAVRGNLGYSLRTGIPIVNEIAIRLWPTLLLAIATIIFTIVIGISTGFLSALRENTTWDHLTRLAALVAVSIPNFWLAFLLILVFSIYLHWLPTHGIRGVEYLILPVVSLGLANAARLSRLTRSCLLEVRHEDYLRTARAKGVSAQGVWLRHALPNIAVPLITLVATQFSLIVAGSVVIETVFAWPGIGNYYVISVSYRDIPAIQSMVVMFAFVFVSVNFFSDVLYALIDPRIRLE